MNLPEEYKTVWITYIGTVHVPDKYYGRDVKQEVTRRAFYSKSDCYYDSRNNLIKTPNGCFTVPQYWEYFTFSDGERALLPHTFFSHGQVSPSQVIKWEYDNTK